VHAWAGQRLEGALVLAADLVAGNDYAWRSEPHNCECALRKVGFAGPARAGKAKVRHRDGELAGLEEWVPTRALVCPWAERAAFLRDESRGKALREAAMRDYDPVVEAAISKVFAATGDEGGFMKVWTVQPERARRLWRRAGLDGEPDQHSLAYTDRRGWMNLPYETALEFARAFATAEPEPCIHCIQEWEDQLRAEGYEPGERLRHAYLRQIRPAHALVREWTQSGELSLLRDENARLGRLLQRALAALRVAGDERSANRIDRPLRGR
jgi:hypothetical protein